MKFHIFALFTLLFLTQTAQANTWLHITDDPWAGFNGQLSYAVTSERARPAAGDIDHDGHTDVVVGAYDGRTTIYWNDGDGTFTEDFNTLAEFDAGYLAVPTLFDVNGDDLLDIIIGSADGTLTLLIANSDRSFTQSSALDTVNVTAFSIPWGVDVDEDGATDILVGGIAGTVKLFMNNGDGTVFTENTTLLAGIDVENDSAPLTADITCDGLQDVVVGSSDGTLALFKQTTSETFEDQGMVTADGNTIDIGNYALPFAIDANEDGCSDLLIGTDDGTVYLFINAGDGTFVEDTTSLGIPDVGAYSAPLADDFDDDGDHDILIAAYDGTLSVFWNNGADFFEETETAYAGIDVGDYSVPYAADLDGNGYNDVILGNTAGMLSVYWNMGAGEFLQDTTRFTTVDVGDTSIPTVADLNGDTHPDILVGSSDGTLTLLSQNADGSFINNGFLSIAASPIDVGSNAFPIASDVDNDGDADLVVGSYSNRLSFFLNDGTGSFSNSALFDAMSLGNSLVPEVGDLDGDGLRDLIVGTEDGNVRWIKQNSDGSFTNQGALQADGIEIDVGENAIPRLADVNDDEVSDLLVSNADGRIAFFTNNGLGALITDTTQFANFDVGDHATIFVEDINADEKNDILLGSLSGRLFLITTDYDDDSFVGLLDCDNTDYHVYAGAPEICDHKDNDCDDEIDEEDTTGTHKWYADIDVDGYGDETLFTISCSSIPSTVFNGGDCNDTDSSINPGVSETCLDLIDNDCDESIDEGCAGSPDFDDDGDGFSEDDGDCDDTNPVLAPNADETCNEIDDDCDLSIDEDASDAQTYYHDADSDGFGDAADSLVSCPSTMSTPSMVSIASDCNDADAAINPNAIELCTDSTDNNCDGVVNEGCATGETSDTSDTSDQSDQTDSSDSSDQSDQSGTSDTGADQGESGASDPAETPQDNPVPIPRPTHADDYGMPSACSLNLAGR